MYITIDGDERRLHVENLTDLQYQQRFPPDKAHVWRKPMKISLLRLYDRAYLS